MCVSSTSQLLSSNAQFPARTTPASFQNKFCQYVCCTGCCCNRTPTAIFVQIMHNFLKTNSYFFMKFLSTAVHKVYWHSSYKVVNKILLTCRNFKNCNTQYKQVSASQQLASLTLSPLLHHPAAMMHNYIAKRGHVTVSSEQIADSCEQHIIAVKRPNMRPSRTTSSVNTRMKVGEYSQSAHMSQHDHVPLSKAEMQPKSPTISSK